MESCRPLAMSYQVTRSPSARCTPRKFHMDTKNDYLELSFKIVCLF